MPPMIGLLQLLAIGFGIYLLALIVYTIWSLTHPRRQSYAWAIHRSLPGDPGELDPPCTFEERTCAGTHGDLTLWILTGNNPHGPRVVMTHGWGSSKLGGLKRLAPVAEHASSVVLWDLPGHGDSAGSARMGTDEHRDLALVLEATRPSEQDGSHDTVLYGWSMGSGISLKCAQAVAQEHSIVSVICESPYIHAITPARNVIRFRGIPYRLTLRPAMAILGTLLGVSPRWKTFARDRIAATIDLPILILHGQFDPISPIGDSEQIAQAAPHARIVVIDDGGHNNLWTQEPYRTQMCDAIGAWIDAQVKPTEQGPSATPSRTGSPARP